MIQKNTPGAVLFTVKTNCSLVQYPITLFSDTWYKHIIPNHPEMVGRLDEVENAVVDPDYVAKSKTGPGARYEGNLVFVSMAFKIRTSHLHVFVEGRGKQYVVGTAVFSKSHHGDKLWMK